jgi:hypothetical protein
MILRHHPDNLAALTDRDLGIKGKPARQFGAELRPGDWLPDHKGARRADVDSIEVFQSFGERGRSASQPFLMAGDAVLVTVGDGCPRSSLT